KFYEMMSQLLSDLVVQRRNDAIAYAEYLERISELVRRAKEGHGTNYPDTVKSAGQKALFDNLNEDEELTLRVDEAVRSVAPDGWRGHAMKEKKVRLCLKREISDEAQVDRILQILKNHSEY
ncbi:MAG: restriction endonuclease subunit R, partial [Agrobacterium tumefaciens]